MRTKQVESAGVIKELTEVLVALSAVSKRIVEHLSILEKRGDK